MRREALTENELRRMMDEHGDALLRMAFLYLHDASDAQDAVQETFLKAYRHYGSFRGDSSERSWLTSIAINTCRDMNRTAWARHVDRRVELSQLPEAGEEFSGKDDTVLLEVMRLKPRDREVIILRYYQGMRFSDLMGEYTVTLDSESGNVLSSEWSLAGVDDGTYTRSTWGGARAYSAELLTYLRDMLDAQAALFAMYPGNTNHGEMSVSDDAAFDKLTLDAGFDPKHAPYTLPSEGGITLAQALSLSRELLIAERGLDGALLDACEISEPDCFMRYPEEGEPVKVWGVSYAGYGEDRQDMYTVILNADTGELEAIYHDMPAVGNG